MNWWNNITRRTALLAWAIALVTITIFSLATLPQQKRIFQENLRSKAYGVTVSLSNIVASAMVNEDYGAVVDHCTEMLKGDASIDHIVLTRSDGFSLVHERDGWRSIPLSGTWRPEDRVARAGIEVVPLLDRRVYRLSQPFGYSGIDWGWIHIGLSLEAYDRSVHDAYLRTGLTALMCTVVSLLASFIYAKHLLRPILDLQGVVQRVAGGDLTARASAYREDELGHLATSVNSMTEALLRRDRTLKEANETLEQRVVERTQALQNQIAARELANRELEEAQRQLVQLAREAGMAEVATGVLHNVGNVLNSVNISANLLRDNIAGSESFELLKQAATLMREQGAHLLDFLTNDPRGKLVPSLIVEVVDQIAIEQQSARRELEQLTGNVDHIKQIVATQQSYAKAGGVIQTAEPTVLFEEAARISRATTGRHGVALSRKFAMCPPIETDRHQVLHILVNLITNAIQALKASVPENRRIELLLSAESGRVRFVVKDNGVGISSENLQRIFRHGFTTRKDGHGFGLHSGWLAARSLGGSLTVESEGAGKGASFTLELPLKAEQRKGDA